MYNGKLDNIVYKYNNTYNTYHKTIKMKSIAVNWSKYIALGIENSDKNLKSKVVVI